MSKEGKFTQEGGGLDNFDQRVQTIEDMNNILNICFEGKQRVNTADFRKINEEISSDTVLAVLGLFRERLPCSENFWRYKRNYDLHVKILNENKPKEEVPELAKTDTPVVEKEKSEVAEVAEVAEDAKVE